MKKYLFFSTAMFLFTIGSTLSGSLVNDDNSNERTEERPKYTLNDILRVTYWRLPGGDDKPVFRSQEIRQLDEDVNNSNKRTNCLWGGAGILGVVLGTAAFLSKTSNKDDDQYQGYSNNSLNIDTGTHTTIWGDGNTVRNNSDDINCNINNSKQKIGILEEGVTVENADQELNTVGVTLENPTDRPIFVKVNTTVNPRGVHKLFEGRLKAIADTVWGSLAKNIGFIAVGSLGAVGATYYATQESDSTLRNLEFAGGALCIAGVSFEGYQVYVNLGHIRRTNDLTEYHTNLARTTIPKQNNSGNVFILKPRETATGLVILKGTELWDRITKSDLFEVNPFV
ncbi:MAG: hypothetical protein WCT20_00705 [Candidatus Babeliales bacterium]|jgi:hypothetical protein